MNQCKGCACFTDASHGGLVDGLCLDCRNPEVAFDSTPVDDAAERRAEELEVMRSRGDL
jgi:hypothetical protein